MRSAESTPTLPFRTPHSTFRTRMYRTSDFEYDLPPELIAQDPLPDRAASRLLVLERASGGIRHARFPDIDRKSTRLNSSHSQISYAVFCLKKKNSSRLVAAAFGGQLLLLRKLLFDPRALVSRPDTLSVVTAALHSITTLLAGCDPLLRPLH